MFKEQLLHTKFKSFKNVQNKTLSTYVYSNVIVKGKRSFTENVPRKYLSAQSKEKSFK